MPHLFEANPSAEGSSDNNGSTIISNLAAMSKGEQVLNDLDASLVGNSGTVASQSAPITSMSEPDVDDSTEEQLGEPNKGEQKHNWKKRYDSSSKENERYRARLRSVEPIIPIVDALLLNPDLLSQVKSSLENGSPVQQKTVLEELGLDDSFEFDAEEAIADETSTSGKALRAVVGQVSNQSSQKSRDEILGAVSDMLEVRDFKAKNKLSEEEFDELVEYAQGIKLDWDTILKLKGSLDPDTNVRKPSPKPGVTGQRALAQPASTPASLSSVGTPPTNKESASDIVFKAILASNQSRKALGQFDK